MEEVFPLPLLLGVWSLNLDLLLALFSRRPCQPSNKKANIAFGSKGKLNDLI